MADELFKFAKGLGKVGAAGAGVAVAPFLIPRVTEELMEQGFEHAPGIAEGVVGGAKGLKDFVNTTPAEAALREYNKETGERPQREGLKGFFDSIFLADKDKDYTIGQTPVAALLRAPDDLIKVATDTAHGITNISDTADTLWKTAKGTAQYADPTEGDSILNAIFDVKGDYRPYAKAIADSFVDKYGSYQDVKNTIATKPVEAALDLSIIPGLARTAVRSPKVIKEGAERAYKAVSKDNPKEAWNAFRSFIRGDNRKPGYIENAFNKFARKLGQIIEEGSFEAVGVTSGVGKAPLINRYRAATGEKGIPDREYLGEVKEGVKNKDVNLGSILSEKLPELRQEINAIKQLEFSLPEEYGKLNAGNIDDISRLIEDKTPQFHELRASEFPEGSYSVSSHVLPPASRRDDVNNISIDDLNYAKLKLQEQKELVQGQNMTDNPMLNRVESELDESINLINTRIDETLKTNNKPSLSAQIEEFNQRKQDITLLEDALKINSANPNEIIEAFQSFIKGKDIAIPEEFSKASSGQIGAINERTRQLASNSKSDVIESIIPRAEGTRQREFFPQDFVRSGAGGALALAGMTLTPGGVGISSVVPFSPRFSGNFSQYAGHVLPGAKQYGRAGTTLARTAWATNLADNVEYQKEKEEHLQTLYKRYGVGK